MAPALDITTTSIDGTSKDEIPHLETTTSTKPIARQTSLQTTRNRSIEKIKDIVSSPTPTTPTTPQNQRFLQASPYPEPTHLLDLHTLTQPLQHFARALTALRPTTPSSYATAPYRLAFNWPTIIDTFTKSMTETPFPPSAPGDEPKLDFYVIVFRSRVNSQANRSLLGELDAAAHLEAVQSGGLLKYWFGTPNGQGRNLATCLWRARSDARRGGAGPGHAQAMRAAASMYDEWGVERLRLSVDVAAGTWEFVPWVD